MSRISAAFLWGLVVAICYVPTVGAAGKSAKLAIVDGSGKEPVLQVVVCGSGQSEVYLLGGLGKKPMKLETNVAECELWSTPSKEIKISSWVVVKSEGNVTAYVAPKPLKEVSIFTSLYPVLLFVGGLLTASLGKILNLTLEPIRYSLVAHFKYRNTKKFFSTVSDSFDKSFDLSKQLQDIARGEYMTNYCLTNKFRARVRTLVFQVGQWKAGTLTSEEFSKALLKG